MAKRTERHVRKVKETLRTPAARSLATNTPDGGRRSAGSYVVPAAYGGSTTKDATGAVGTPGNLNVFGFLTGEDYNPDLDGYPMFPNYNKMRLGDAQVNATLLMLKLPLKGATWQIDPASDDPEDVAIADFVQANLIDDNALIRSWQHVLDNAMLKFDFGCAGAEIIWGLDEVDGAAFTKIVDLAPRLPRTFYRWVEDPKTGRLAYLQQFAPKNGQYGYWNIPADAFCVHVRAREGNNYYGRAMVPETRIPTPEGWQALGDLRVGDRVFDESGRICTVMAKSPIWRDRPCYRVQFGDGSTIIADANHLWLTRRRLDRFRADDRKGVRTTAEIARSVRDSERVVNHSIDLTQPLECVEASLPVAPYVLGLWLGDGTSDCSRISTNKTDEAETVSIIQSLGYETSVAPNGAKHGAGRLITVKGLVTRLRWLDVIRNKHVPAVYMRASVGQRRALLAGLMDSDGYFGSKNGVCEFANNNPRLIAAVVELVRSLGGTAKVRINPSRRGDGDRVVQFYPPFAPFCLTRKRLPAERAVTKRTKAAHYIVSVEQVTPRDTVCIEVDSPSHLFLAGEAMVPTHNSVLRTSYPHWWWKSQLYRIDMIGHDRFHVGIPRAKMTADYSANSAPLDKLEQTLKGLRSHDRAYMVQPWGVEYDVYGAGSTGTHTSGILNSIEHHNLMIARNILQSFAAQGEQRHGSFGAAKVTSDVYFDALEGEAREIASEIGQTVARPLCDRNFEMRGRKYPKVTCVNISAVDFPQLATAMATLADKGLITPEDDLEAWLRDLADAPGLPEALKGQPRNKPVGTAAPPMSTPGEPAPPADGKTPPEPDDTIAAAKHAAFHEQGRAFSREPTSLERRIFDLHGIPTALETAKDALVHELATIRREQLHTVAARIAQKDSRPTGAFTDIRHAHVTMPKVADLTKAIRAAQTHALAFGRQSVRSELAKQGVRAARDLNGAFALADNETSARNARTATSTLVSSARITATRQAEAWRARILEEALRLRRTGLRGPELVARIVNNLDDDAESGARRDAGAEIHEGFGIGRALSAQELRDSIEQCVYSAILDVNTCDTCQDLDGEEFAIDSAEYHANLPPNANCDGRDQCRCVFLYVATEDAGAA